MENDGTPTHGFTQQQVEAAYQLGRKALTLATGDSGLVESKTQDGKTVCKVVLGGKCELKGWAVIPNGLIAAADTLGGVLRFDLGNGASLYIVPESAGYSVRQTMAEKRGLPAEWANATYPRKTAREDGTKGKTRYLD